MHATTREIKAMVKRSVEWEMEEVPFVEGVEFELRLLDHIAKMDRKKIENLMEDELLESATEHAQDVLSNQSEEFGGAADRYFEKVREGEFEEMMDQIWDDKMHIVECCERIRFAVDCQIKTILGEK